MNINSISVPNYANLTSRANIKNNLKSNVNFEGAIYLDDRLRKWCGGTNIECRIDEWKRRIPDDTSVSICYKTSDGYYIDVFKVLVRTPEHNWYYRDLDMWHGGMNDNGSCYDLKVGYSNKRKNFERLDECIADCAQARKNGLL